MVWLDGCVQRCYKVSTAGSGRNKRFNEYKVLTELLFVRDKVSTQILAADENAGADWRLFAHINVVVVVNSASLSGTGKI